MVERWEPIRVRSSGDAWLVVNPNGEAVEFSEQGEALREAQRVGREQGRGVVIETGPDRSTS